MQEETISKWEKTKWEKISHSDDLLAELSYSYFKEYGSEPCCPNTLKEFHDKILSEIVLIESNLKFKQSMETTERKFLLKDNIVQYYPAHHCHYTNANLTDEIAIEMLSRSPRMISNFEKYPENYLELIGKVEEEATVEQVTTEDVATETPTEEVKEEVRSSGKKGKK